MNSLTTVPFSYRQNASRLSRMMAARPRNQRDELVKHVRFAAEFGSLPEYRIPQVSFLQYYMLDIILPVIFVVSSCVVLSLYACLRVILKLTSAKVKTA
uniref:Glucuronosyltransferase n=1 Tax=Steinernema glaseri TaxID=37863 RepID=A0A1I7ZSD6_9BILA